MQHRTGARELSPELPGGEKAKARAETELGNVEGAGARPARWQIIAFEIHMPGLGETVLHRVIGIVKALRNWNMSVPPAEAQVIAFGPHCAGVAQQALTNKG